MNIVVITHNKAHFKTQQVIFGLLSNGIRPKVIILPFIERKSFVPIWEHRPGTPFHVSPTEFCDHLQLEFISLDDVEQINELSKNMLWFDTRFIITTGTVLPANITSGKTIINVHPGLLPEIKGLDALKWALLHSEPIGVTAHLIDEEVDGGVLLERVEVPLYWEDSFHSFAQRVLEYEISLSVKMGIIHEIVTKERIGASVYPTHRRMPHRLEVRMMEKFEIRRQKAPLKSEIL